MSWRAARPIGPIAVLFLWGLPLALGLTAFAAQAFNRWAWAELLKHPQVPKALLLSLWTGGAGLILALLAATLITAGVYGREDWQRLQSFAVAGLAIPHLAFAIGFGLLIMPSGLIARLLVGGAAPPQWVTAHDPAGLSLIACLAFKETPFLIAMMWGVLARGDFARGLEGQWRQARSLGHGRGSIWLRVFMPQILAEIAWPIVIVWAYGATVVDMALVIGPTQPPTLAVIVWSDLNNAAEAVNARGAAGAIFLTLAIAAAAFAGIALLKLLKHPLHLFMARGPSKRETPAAAARALAAFLVVVFGLVTVLLALISIAGHWTYPELLPHSFRLDPWWQLAQTPQPLLLSLGLAFATSAAALALAVLWFETMTEHFDNLLLAWALLALGLPSLAVAGGQYRLFLDLGLTGTLQGLFLAHLGFVFAYVFIVLRGPYRGFDPRYKSVACGLNASGLRFWAVIKAPLLKAPLFTSGAVGFAVSMAEFVPSQLMAAGRFSTLPMEAVTLASGGDRSRTAAFALALALPPALAFLAAFALGRPRWGLPWR